MKVNQFPDRIIEVKEESYLYFGDSLFRNASPEFQELIIKTYCVGLNTEVPEMQIYSLQHMKRRRISKELYWCSCYSYCFIRDACRKISD
jgi:hypothetical protein